VSTPTLAQSSNTGGGATLTETLSYTSAQTAGNANLIIVYYNWTTTDPGVTCKDSVNGNYTELPNSYSSGGVSVVAFVVYSIGAASAGGNTVTITFGSATNNSAVDFSIFEVSGAGLVDQTLGTLSTTSPAEMGPVTTLYASELAIAYARNGSGTSAGSGWTSISGTFRGGALEQNNLATAGSVSAPFVPGGGAGSFTYGIIVTIAPPQGIAVPFWAA
jgi:hypothetical protein